MFHSIVLERFFFSRLHCDCIIFLCKQLVRICLAPNGIIMFCRWIQTSPKLLFTHFACSAEKLFNWNDLQTMAEKKVHFNWTHRSYSFYLLRLWHTRNVWKRISIEMVMAKLIISFDFFFKSNRLSCAKKQAIPFESIIGSHRRCQRNTGWRVQSKKEIRTICVNEENERKTNTISKSCTGHCS